MLRIRGTRHPLCVAKTKALKSDGSNLKAYGGATKCQFELFTYKTMYLLDVNLIQLV